MKKRILLFLTVLAVLCCLVAFVSCGKTKKPSPPETTGDPSSVSVTFVVGGRTETVTLGKGETPSYTGSVLKPSDEAYTYRFTGWDKAFSAVSEDTTYTALYETVPLVTYEIRWILYDSDVTTTVKENDIPVPPACEELIQTDRYIATFEGWSAELVPMTVENAALQQNRIVRALYDTVERKYQVKFMVDGQLYATTETGYGKTPTLPETAPTKTGYNSMMWIGSDKKITDNEQVCTAAFTMTDGTQLYWALSNPTPLSYRGSKFDNAAEVMTASNAILYLLYEIRQTDASNPYFEAYVNRIVEQLRRLIDPSENGAPHFDLCCNWPYCNLTAAITLCKNTPAVWSVLTESERSQYDFIMECFAYVLTLGTDDENNYSTGPGLTGNYNKEWNPNFRIANVMPMVFVGEYFGGAAAVNAMLLAFDYDAVIAKFEEYGFARAYTCWTASPAQKADGSYYPSPKDFMMNGGEIFLNTANGTLHYVPGTAAGTGVGVRTTYTYRGYTLNEPEKIIASLLQHNYSGGAVKSSFGTYSNGSPKAYIEGYLKSPYEGERGMMKEFAGSDGGNGKDGSDIRSSTDYCSHDFLMIVGALVALTELDIYAPMDNDNLSLFRLVWVGNQDFIFKFQNGYMSYSLGASKGIKYESDENGYLLLKSWWNEKYGDLKLESFPEPIVIFDPVILDESYTGTNIQADTSTRDTHQDVGYDANGKAGVTMQTVSGSNPYLQVKVLAGGADPMINLQRTGGLPAFMDKYTSFTVSVRLAKQGSERVLESNYRLRAGNSSNVLSVFRTTANGDVVFGDGKKITTLTTEFQTISVQVDFEAEILTAYLNGTKIGTSALKVPGGKADTTATNGLEWLKSIRSFIFNWYFASSSTATTDGYLLIDDLKICVDETVSETSSDGVSVAE